MTLETNRVKTNIAILVFVTARRKLEGDLMCTTALAVLYCCTTRFARSCVFAFRAIWHGEDEVNVSVESYRNVEMRNRELIPLSRRNLGTATTILW